MKASGEPARPPVPPRPVDTSPPEPAGFTDISGFSYPVPQPRGPIVAATERIGTRRLVRLYEPGHSPIDVALPAEAVVRDYRWSDAGASLLVLADEHGNEQRGLFVFTLATRQVTRVSCARPGNLRILRVGSGGSAPLIAQDDDTVRYADVYELTTAGTLRHLFSNPGRDLLYLGDMHGRGMLVVRATPRGHDWLWRYWSGEETLLLSRAGPHEVSNRPLRVFSGHDAIYARQASASGTNAIVRHRLSGPAVTPIASDRDYDIVDVLFADGGPALVRSADPVGRYRLLRPASSLPDLAQLRDFVNGLPAYATVTGNGGRSWIIETAAQDGTRDGPHGGATYLQWRPEQGVVARWPRHRQLATHHNRPKRHSRTLSPDGLSIDTFVTLPDGPRPHPTVLKVHGGPFARDDPGVDLEAQWFAAQGLATLQVNYRGSSGRGVHFARMANGQWSGAVLDDLICAIQRKIQQGWVDPHGIVAMGRSFGGFAVLHLAARYPELIRGAVTINPLIDVAALLDAVAARRPADLARLESQIGLRHHDREQLAAMSPLAGAERITCPLLLVLGARDARVQVAAGTTFIARTRATWARTLMFRDEGHDVVKAGNRGDMYRAVRELLIASGLRPWHADPVSATAPPHPRPGSR